MKIRQSKIQAIKLLVLIFVSFAAVHAASEGEIGEGEAGTGHQITTGQKLAANAAGSWLRGHPCAWTEAENKEYRSRVEALRKVQECHSGETNGYRELEEVTGRASTPTDEVKIMDEICARRMVLADQAGAGIGRQNSTAFADHTASQTYSTFPPHPMFAKSEASDSNVSSPYVFNINAFSGSEFGSHNGTTGQITRQNSTASSSSAEYYGAGAGEEKRVTFAVAGIERQNSTASSASASASASAADDKDATAGVKRFIRSPLFDAIRTGAIGVDYKMYSPDQDTAHLIMLRMLIEREYTYAADSSLEKYLDEKFGKRKDDYADGEVNHVLKYLAFGGKSGLERYSYNISAEQKLAQNLSRNITEKKIAGEPHEVEQALNAMTRFLALTEANYLIPDGPDSKRRKTKP